MEKKWENLGRQSIKLNKTVRVRLANPSDREFLEEMGGLSGGERSFEHVEDPNYQKGLKASLLAPGGYIRKVVEIHNRAVAGGNPIPAALAACSFDFVAFQGKEPVGALSVGGSVTALSALLEQQNAHHVLEFMFKLPKLNSLAVLPHLRGEKIGAHLMKLLQQILPQLGSTGIYGDCSDTSGLVKFYEGCGCVVLPSGSRLDISPVFGRQVVGHSGPSNGPLLGSEPGYRKFFITAGKGSDAEYLLHAINGLTQAQVS